ncbi:ejaculatory bulb-specific protein 3-like [Chelonus insularis]|uniref:ejaculatory bulb-specific protein 3-like n=1 Tax=Chelonus insularis TaxID=460826 RepID=UPI00158F44C8|nr:ejaculatory bulb-specific protein 3-like [Chelonus insularis]
MKIAIVFLAVVAIALARPDDKMYTTKYDNIDVDGILASNRLLNNYVNCLMDKGPCSPEGKELKSLLPDALESECKKCSEKQKAASEKVIRFLVNERPELWNKLAGKYDPEGVYKKKYENQAKASGINV